MSALSFSVLGPLVAWRDERPLDLGGPKRRAVLATLLVDPRRPVRAEAIADVLWGDDPPATAGKTVQKYISQLRKELGESLVTVPGGYQLAVSPEAVDAVRFEAMVAAAPTMAPEDGIGVLTGALDLWRGEPFPELAGSDAGLAVRTRLEELRLTAVEAQVEAELALGRHATAVGRIEELVAAHPLRERLWGQLMVALYRSGRQAEALRAYQRLRHVLGDELGIEPSPELQDLEIKMLTHDPEIAASASALTRRTNLPVALDSFVGRADDMTAIAGLVAETRLVTLVGPGGSGKTRLALETAGDVVDRYRDGVWLVDLAPLTSPEQVALRLADPFGVAGEGNRPTEVVLEEHLAARHLLLIVDNCEHLVAATASLVGRLLRAAPGLTVLATSRQPLGVPGEVVYEVPPLECPPAGEDQHVEGTDAGQLFVARAKAADPRLTLTGDDLAAVADICRRLDGMPLALELAAARLRAFAPRQLAELLDERFDLLVSADAGQPGHHGTLRQALTWSYDLLSGKAQVLFNRLSVFRGGFDLIAATAVCGADPLSPDDVPPLIAELVDKSLVVAVTAGASTRFRLLETLCELGREHLDDDQIGAIDGAHAGYFCSLAEDAGRHLRGSGQAVWMRRLATDIDNLRAALRHAFAHDPGTGVRIATALADYWDAAGPRVEAHQWLRRAVDASSTAEPAARIRVLLAASDLFVSTHLGHSVGYAEEALELACRSGDGAAEARAMRALSTVLGWGEEVDRAVDLGKKAVAFFTAGDDVWELGWSLERLAQALYQDPARSVRHYEEALAIFREVGDRRRASLVLYKMAERMLQAEGDADAAERWIRESLSISDELGTTHDRAHALLALGRALGRQGHRDGAISSLEAAIDDLRRVGDQRCTVRGLSALGLALVASGDTERAGAVLEESLATAIDERVYTRASLDGVAGLWAATGGERDAVVLFAVTSRLRRQLGLPVPENAAARRDHLVADLRDRIGADTFSAAWDDGERMTVDEAVAYALERLHETTDDRDRVW